MSRIVPVTLLVLLIVGALSLLTMCSQQKIHARQVRIIEVVERKDDFAYVVRIDGSQEREVLYSKERLSVPFFVDVTLPVSGNEIISGEVTP